MAGARIGVTAASKQNATSCDTTEGSEPLEPEVSSGADGRFRAHVFSVSGPGLRCIRVIAYTTGSGDSIAVDGLLVQFRIDRESPDSLGLVMKLP